MIVELFAKFALKDIIVILITNANNCQSIVLKLMPMENALIASLAVGLLRTNASFNDFGNNLK